MANEEHLELLRAGVTHWNHLRGSNSFTPDFEDAEMPIYLQKADMRDANLINAQMQKANLRFANFQSADLRLAKLSGADFHAAKLDNADLRSGYKIVDGKKSNPLRTTLKRVKNLTQAQIDAAIGTKGPSGTVLPNGLEAPDHWVDELIDFDAPPPPVQKEKFEEEENEVRHRTTYISKNPPPVELEEVEEQLDIRLDPRPSHSPKASATPIDIEAREIIVDTLKFSTNALCDNLQIYTKETHSDRATTATQLIPYLQKLELQLAKGAAKLLPTAVQDMIESIEAGYLEASHAFEEMDTRLLKAVIQRGRQLYPFYPILAHIQDPSYSEAITEEFPFTATDLIHNVRELVNSEAGMEVFTDATRAQVEHEANVPSASVAFPEKEKQARFGALVGEMSRKMNDRVSDTANWITVAEQVQRLWDAIAPFLGA